MKPLYQSTSEVAEALSNGTPVVALESTIITHGMPYPENLAVARAVENVVRENGAVPATIAIIDGTLKIGLSSFELEVLSKTKNAKKASRADFAWIMSEGLTGSTTVAATMIAAHLAGIKVFATGGIGGVHRGVVDTFDVSADLQELAQTPVTVVCAGAKAILDLPKTFEVLETLGVPVIAYGQNKLPAFWSRTTNIDAPLSASDPNQIAQSHTMRNQLGLPGGQLVANPIPVVDEIAQHILEPWIANAMQECIEANIKGKDVTPYLLGRILEQSKGASLKANIALVKNNAALAAKIALCMTT